MSYFIKYIRKYFQPFIAAIACLGVEAVCDLMQPTIMARIIDVGVATRDMHYILMSGLLMLGVTAAGALGAIGRNYLASNVSQRFGRDLRLDLFTKIQGFSFSNINRFDTASLVTRLTNDVTQVQHFSNGIMRIFVKAPLLGIGGIIMAILLNPRMAMIIVIVVPFIAVLIFINMRFGFPLFMKIQKALDRVNSVVREYLSGVRVVKAFNRSAYEGKRFTAANEELRSVSTKTLRIMAGFSPGNALIVHIGIIAVLWFGGISVNAGSMQVGKIVAFINYMTQILFALMMISFIFTVFIRAKASFERIAEVFREQPGMAGNDKPLKTGQHIDTVAFDHVFFSYDGKGSEPVLSNISFSCARGMTVGIIGSTGAGKSSLVSLIPRFYDVMSGAVLIGGIDVRELDIKDLRRRIAVVPQKTILFTGTIRENILQGRDDADTAPEEVLSAEIEKAAECAQAADFIRAFPEGYDTLLGQGGVNLSGGQKQRISIARALVRKPEILILDDSTSSVDVITEAEIRKAVKAGFSDITCFIIAQRITSVMDADTIIVLDQGRICGTGTHAGLIAACDVYRDILLSQTGKGGMSDAAGK